MSTQVYAVVHDGAGNFLMAKKNIYGYFFHDAHGPGGTILPNGSKLNGGGKHALPGGGLEGTMAPAEGAQKEFREETNVDLANFNVTLHPAAFQGVENARLDYWGVFFQVSQPDFQIIYREAILNVRACVLASAAVRTGIYGRGRYDELMQMFQGCPPDDELHSIHEWNLGTKWPTIQSWHVDSDLSWFYNILNHWRLNP